MKKVVEQFKEQSRQLLALGVAIASLYSGTAVFADDEPQFKMDTPKLDTTVPKSSLLKGGVQHHESYIDPKTKLNGNANSDKGKFHLFSGKAKTDKNKPLTGQLRDPGLLNTYIQSGVGIIGVKFVLAFGRPPVINRVFPGTPAYSVGLRNNDVIMAVDGVPTYGLSKEDVYGMIVGTPGTAVTLTVTRNGDFLPRTMTRMDFNDIVDPNVRRDYLMSM